MQSGNVTAIEINFFSGALQRSIDFSSCKTYVWFKPKKASNLLGIQYIEFGE